MRIRIPGQSTWSRGICKTRVGPRSHEIEVGATTYRRNCAHTIPTKEQRDSDILPFNLTLEDDDTVRDGSVLQGEMSNTLQGGKSQPTLSELSAPSEVNTPIPRQSNRTRRPPRWTAVYLPL